MRREWSASLLWAESTVILNDPICSSISSPQHGDLVANVLAYKKLKKLMMSPMIGHLHLFLIEPTAAVWNRGWEMKERVRSRDPYLLYYTC